MKHRVITVGLAVVLGASHLLSQSPAEAPKELQFRLQKIDGPVHDPANHSYWFGPFAECSSTLDINGDGKTDIAAGRNYYLAPDWKKVKDFRDGAATNGPDVDDNYEGTIDVNNDGRPDILSSGWMLKQGVYWYENPGKPGVKWTSHTIHAADGLEGMVIGNLAGRDGKDVLVNYFARRPGRSVIWYEHLDQAPWFKEHKLGPEGIGVSHGSGIGDLNGDGRNDVVTTSGWFEAPAKPTEDPWIWHPDFQFVPYGSNRPGGAGLPILVTDTNGDGLNDLIMGSDHGYGLAWFEQKMENGKRTFTQRWIETEYPTFHTMSLADLDGDGKPELITGKQLLAHNGGDVGVLEPSFLFYYTFDKGRFQRHILAYSHLEPLFAKQGFDGPPPQDVIGTGMRLSVADLDGNGKQDIVVACRTGLYVFFNNGYSERTRGRNPLPDRTSYPGNIIWDARPATPKPSDGSVSLFDGTSLSAWRPAQHWTIEDGVIALKNRTDRQEHNDNYLWTKEQYGDFVLDLDFKAIQGTNSGVYLRASNMDDPVQTGLEVQVGSLAPGRPLAKGSVGGIYDLAAPRVNAVLPDVWNHYTITCKGPNITVLLNGQQVSEIDLDRWTEPLKNPDGTANKFTRAMKDFARTGYVGLQDHGSPGLVPEYSDTQAMKMQIYVLTLFLGVVLAVHLAMNGKVGSVLNNPRVGNALFWAIGAVTALIIGVTGWREEALTPLKDVHPALLTAGAMGATLVFAIAWLIPQAGAGPVMIMLIAGQIIGGMLLSHFGWLGSPVERITLPKLGGVGLMLAGVFLATFRK